MPTETNENAMISISKTANLDNNTYNNESISSSTTTATSATANSLSPVLSASPPQSSSKQLDKLRRFLSTLYYFGSDISCEIGERVRALIIALINNALSIEEFHSKLQLTTNFPLRPFALPFLKSTLPILQQDLSQLARQSKQSISQFLIQHEELIFLSRDLLENDLESSKEQINENGKRKLSNDSNELDERPHTAKRSTTSHSTYSITSIQRNKERGFSSYLHEYSNDFKLIDDDWKNAEHMLNHILEMVAKSKRILFMLQQKDIHFRRILENNDLEWRRRHTELLNQTDERIADIRRKAEETVLEIKRQSIVDLQKAIAQSERRSNEMIIREREKYERLKIQTHDEAFELFNRQEDSPEHCWHCARKAIETCSGCNIARYCGEYCQHRDWELHKRLCSPDLKQKLTENPQIYRSRPISKTNSSDLDKDSSPVTIPPRNLPSVASLNNGKDNELKNIDDRVEIITKENN